MECRHPRAPSRKRGAGGGERGSGRQTRVPCRNVGTTGRREARGRACPTSGPNPAAQSEDMGVTCPVGFTARDSNREKLPMAQDMATGQRQLKPSFQKISFVRSMAVHRAPSLQSTTGDRQGTGGHPGDERLRKPQPARGAGRERPWRGAG